MVGGCGAILRAVWPLARVRYRAACKMRYTAQIGGLLAILPPPVSAIIAFKAVFIYFKGIFTNEHAKLEPL
nr:MAG TPA: hypothetical protein [Caudoviricetes sp.]